MLKEAKLEKAHRSIVSRFRGLATSRNITLFIFVLCSLLVYQFGIYMTNSIEREPEANQDLSGIWEVCVSEGPSPVDCKWATTKVPGDLPDSLAPKLRGWLIYKRKFTAPSSCLQKDSSCAIFLEEVGDTVEAAVNGLTIGRHGEFPPNALYAKHYPALFDLSRDLLRSGNNANELVLTVYSLQRIQAGIRRGPVAVFTNGNAFQVTQAAITNTIFLPLLSFVGLFLIAVIGGIIAFSQDTKDKKIHAYIRYCCAASLFMLSFSELPREYLPICIAGFSHAILRILYDWAYFEMICEYFNFGDWTKRFLRPLYLCVLGIIVFALIAHGLSKEHMHSGVGFDLAFKILKWSFPLILLPHILGLIGACTHAAKRSRLFFICLFAVLIFCQIHDVLVFHGFLRHSYFAKFYPFIIGLIFGIYYLNKSREERSLVLVEREKTKQLAAFHQIITGLVHEFRAPTAGLAMARDEVIRNPNNTGLVSEIVQSLPSYTDKILAVTKDIFEYSKDLSQGVRLNKQKVDLSEFLSGVISGFQMTYLGRKVPIKLEHDDISATVVLDLVQMDRVITNLLKNSVESCSNIEGAQIVVSSRVLVGLEQIEISVSDNGPEIPDSFKERLFQPFATFGKEGGVGMGLVFCKLVVEAHCGSLALKTQNGKSMVASIPLQG